ncbi:hypothetical protein Nepgr_012393 [Nepenthes gracilis]|uniref:Uncharacterized protein n=1 Tax=Nepenthes gracilis TaxID=150966 RepID=A0AAD3SG18_NEPGR|nr:hypothetical protein Nepgr_012393 [Nepenthes gracilis]
MPALAPQLLLRESVLELLPETLKLVIEPQAEPDIELSVETEEEVVKLLAESVELAGETRAEAAELAYEPQVEPADELQAQPLSLLISRRLTCHLGRLSSQSSSCSLLSRQLNFLSQFLSSLQWQRS